jgi:sugar O-acyltransferase (sialic acid O-acetyltransferase NeuD family)
MDLPIIIVGAGGHGSVIADALLAAGKNVLGFTDPSVNLTGHFICGLKVLGSDAILSRYSQTEVLLANGIGEIPGLFEKTVRSIRQRELKNIGWRFCSVKHPSSIISPFAKIGEGVQLLAGSIVQVNAILNEGVLINTGAVVEHDVEIGSWTHIAPRSIICGGTHIGSECFIGAGSIIKQGLEIGNNIIVGAGSTVLKSFNTSGLLVGTPAKMIDR